MAQPDPILQFFDVGDLPARLAIVAAPFAGLAAHVHATVPRNAERTTALRKLLEAKDAAVRAAMLRGYMPTGGGPDCPAHDSRCTPERCVWDSDDPPAPPPGFDG